MTSFAIWNSSLSQRRRALAPGHTHTYCNATHQPHCVYISRHLGVQAVAVPVAVCLFLPTTMPPSLILAHLNAAHRIDFKWWCLIFIAPSCYEPIQRTPIPEALTPDIEIPSLATRYLLATYLNPCQPLSSVAKIFILSYSTYIYCTQGQGLRRELAYVSVDG